MEESIFVTLAACPLFNGIAESELMQNLAHIRYSVRQFEKGMMIARRDEKIHHLMIVLNGIVRGEMMDYSGKLLRIEEMVKGQPLAAAFLFSSRNTFPVDVIASDTATIIYFPKDEVINLLQVNVRFLHNFLASISNRSQFLTQKLFMLSFKTIRAKIAQYILEKAGSNLRIIEIGQTQQNLADLFGVTRPSLARVLGELENEGIIKTDRKSITIIDRKRLAEQLS